MLDTKTAFSLCPKIIRKLELRKGIREIKNNAKEEKMTKEELGEEIELYIIEHLDLAQNEIFKLISIVLDKDIKTLEEQTVKETIKDIKKMLDNKELTDFFGSSL